MLRVYLWLVLLCNSAYAALEPSPQGSRAAGLGGCSVILTDVWSIANNPGASAFASRSQFALFGQNAFGIKTLNSFAFAALLKQSWGNPGIHLQHTGIGNYSEQQVSLSYGKSYIRLSVPVFPFATGG